MAGDMIFSPLSGFAGVHDGSLWLKSCTLLWLDDLISLHPPSTSPSFPNRRSKASRCKVRIVVEDVYQQTSLVQAISVIPPLLR